MLCLWHVSLEIIHPRAFCGLLKLRSLVLHGNKLRRPPELTPLKSTLYDLKLRSNRLVSIPSDYFKHFLKLKRLEIDDNQLLAVPSVHWVSSSLRILSLSKNQITSLEGFKTNASYQKLSSLILAENNIFVFDLEILSSMPKLIHLDLKQNLLKTMWDYRPLLSQTPDLFGNPFHCNESMAWISGMEWYRQNNVGFGDASPECETPWCLTGKKMHMIGKIMVTVMLIIHHVIMVVVNLNITDNIVTIVVITPDNKVHGANMGPTWVLSAPDGPHVGQMNLAIRDIYCFGRCYSYYYCYHYNHVIILIIMNHITISFHHHHNHHHIIIIIISSSSSSSLSLSSQQSSSTS